MQDSPQASPKGGDEPPPQQPKADNNGPQDQISKKQIQDANYKQQQAQKDINEEKNKEATEKQGEAIEKLKDAKKKLEDRLAQLREEELERILANLLLRCEEDAAHTDRGATTAPKGVHKSSVPGDGRQADPRATQATIPPSLSNKEEGDRDRGDQGDGGSRRGGGLDRRLRRPSSNRSART